MEKETIEWVIKELEGIMNWPGHRTPDDVYFDLRDLVKRLEKEK